MILSVVYGVTIKESKDAYLSTAEIALNGFAEQEYLAGFGWIIFQS